MNNNNSAQEVPQWLKDEAEKAAPHPDAIPQIYRQYFIEGYITAALTPSPAKDEQVREEDRCPMCNKPAIAVSNGFGQVVEWHCDSCKNVYRVTLSKGQAEPKEEGGCSDECINSGQCDTTCITHGYYSHAEIKALNERIAELEAENKQLRAEQEGEKEAFISFMENYVYGSETSRRDKDIMTNRIWNYIKGRTATEPPSPDKNESV